MVDHATAKYLNDNIGGVLAKALAEMSVAQPTDGVDFLARWLRTYAEQEEAKLWREKEERTLEEERAKTKAKLDEREARRRRKHDQIDEKNKRFQDFVAKMANPETTFDDSCWKELVDVAQVHTGAKSVYLGKLEEGGIEGIEGKCVCYTHASPGSESMLENVLKEGVGVSWGALTENPTEEVLHLWRPPKQEPEVPVDPDSGEPPPEAPTIPYLPVNVGCVTDVPEVHYFDMTRLGAYMAVPLVYSSYYTPEALADAMKYEQDKKDAQRAAEAEAAAAAEAEGDAAGEAGERPAAEEVPEKPMELRGAPVRVLLCMDTLGTNAAIEVSKIPDLMELCKAVGKCKEQTETRQVDSQALFVIDEQERQASTDENAKSSLIAQCRSDVAAALQEEMEQEDQAATEGEQKELVQEKYKYLRAQQAFVRLKDLVLELESWVVVTPEVLNVIAAMAFMYRYKKEQIYPKRKPALTWDALKVVLNNDLFKAVEEIDVCEERGKGISQEWKLSSIKEMASPAGLDEEKASQVAPAFEVIFTLIQAACSYRSKHLAVCKSEYAQRKDAAAAAEEPFTETAPEELDDDYAES